MRILLAVAALFLPACVATTIAGSPAPRPAMARVEPFVVAANPLAAGAGAEILRNGGSAVDAAIAVQAMLTLVEPQSSGIGGGAFMTYYDGATRKVMVYDGRETAPAQATSGMFLDADGKPMPFADAVLSGRSTGVPGVVAMLALAHRERGRLAWSNLFGRAIRTAEQGFVVSPRLERMIDGKFPQNGAADVVAYFGKPDGSRLRSGDLLRNPAYGAFLRRLAAEGPDALYRGSTAAKIVERLRNEAIPGSMTMADLAGYAPIKREALCRPYRAYLVCGPPPPASGVGTLELLGLLERTDIALLGPTDPTAWFLFAEASRLMYADRDRYVGDPAFVSIPVNGLLDPNYLDSRARLIGTIPPGVTPAAGLPKGAAEAAPDRTLEPAGTSHFVVRDGAGNVVSMTTTVESIFGSGRMVDGFFLNNQLTDFSFSPIDSEGRPAANAVAPGKRPRSSMTPLILMDRDRRFAGAIGSAGGNAILAYVVKSLVAAIDWNLSMQEALAQPNLVARGTSYGAETDKLAPGVVSGLAARGISLRSGQGENSGVHAVLIRKGRIEGGYDPRREGRVLILPAD